jgi:hypothetical protein
VEQPALAIRWMCFFTSTASSSANHHIRYAINKKILKQIGNKIGKSKTKTAD